MEPLSGGNGVFIGAAVPVDLAAVGYAEEELAASGTASSYAADDGLTDDGRWTFRPDGSAPYRTRVLVRRPVDPARFSGTVLVEWLNVSGGVDADPDWASLHEEITRRGHVWVGVSAQQIGVVGGAVLVEASGPGAELAGRGLTALDPARYGGLAHPGDGFAFDIFTQVAQAVRDGFGDLRPERVVAVGESQSAIALVTYYNGVQPLTAAFDGFFVHSRGAAALPLAAPGESADLAGALMSGVTAVFRSDVDAPVLCVQTETDLTGVLASAKARQPDSDRFRLWEVAGTAHADAHLLGANAAAIDCGAPINDGPMHVVAKAALRALTTWLETGRPPAPADRLRVESDAVERDADGIALGGVRTPPVDVPVDTLSGDPGPNPSMICLLLGSTKPLPEGRLAELYPARANYEQRYADATEKAISAGFVLDEDRAALLTYAHPDRLPT